MAYETQTVLCAQRTVKRGPQHPEHQCEESVLGYQLGRASDVPNAIEHTGLFDDR